MTLSVGILLYDGVELLDFAGPYEVFTVASRVTAAGISAGIDMALHLVVRFAGRELAVRTAEYMQYEWEGDSPLNEEEP